MLPSSIRGRWWTPTQPVEVTPMRNELIGLWEVERYGSDSFVDVDVDVDYGCVYGLRPREWYGHGVRLFGRTVVECTRPLLEASAPSRVIVVASGGMYTEPLDVDALDPEAAAYDGTKTYARCKRAQVVLAEEWTQHLLDAGITVNAMHPGWANTPGLRTALPGFSRIVGPLLRTPEQGADTIVWLAAAPDAADLSGLFFLDRRARAKHRLRRTRRPDAVREAERLWRVCTERTAPFTAGTR
jgi:NAD(P)-dependent dehydrogenase (short-subunit alcohol dehydrogenase family)